MAAKKSRTHQVVVTLTFDKACTRKVALREARDSIFGKYYCTELNAGEPGEFRVRSVRLAKASGATA